MSDLDVVLLIIYAAVTFFFLGTVFSFALDVYMYRVAGKKKNE